MIRILASDFKHYHKENGYKIANSLDNSNGIVDQIKEGLKNNNCFLYIPADSSNKEKIDLYFKLIVKGLELSGIKFNEYLILDDYNVKNVSDYVSRADMIFLSGGDTYVQNQFLKRIDFKEHLKEFQGLILGQSAGAMNMAYDVFNSPENMENSEPIYFNGLGLTNINIEPHFIYDRSSFNDADNYKRDAIIKESYRRIIYGQCNGSHILIDDDNKITIYGETYLIDNGKIEKICEEKENYMVVNLNDRHVKS